MSVALNGTSVALSLLSTIFFIIGSAGLAQDKSTVMNTAWIVSSQNGLDYYWGLQKVFAHYSAFGYTLDVSVKYTSGDCGDNWCNTCQSDGQGAGGLTIIALIFAVVTLAFSGALIGSKNRSMQICNVLMSFFAAFSSLVAIGLFMSQCYNSINNSDDDDYDDSFSLSLKWGPGSILTILGMLLMWIVVVLQIAAAATSA
jgi:uncharacterized membrane protein